MSKGYIEGIVKELGLDMAVVLKCKDDSEDLERCVQEWRHVTKWWTPPQRSQAEEEVARYTKDLKMTAVMERTMDNAGRLVGIASQVDWVAKATLKFKYQE